jgi:aconitate hydratase
MGILPLEYIPGETRATHGLTGDETYDILGITERITPRSTFTVRATAADGTKKEFSAIVRIDTPDEAEYYRHGGILQYVLRSLASN